MCNNMAKENSGIDASQAFKLAVYHHLKRIMPKIEDAAAKGGTDYYISVAPEEKPLARAIIRRLESKGYKAELHTYDEDTQLEISWDHADEPEPCDCNRIKPIKELPPTTCASEEEERHLWSIKQWETKVKELNGMITFLQDENTKMRNEMDRVKIENTWLEADSYKIPYNKQVLAYVEGECQKAVVGVLTKDGHFVVQFVVEPCNDKDIPEGLIGQWKRFSWPHP